MTQPSSTTLVVPVHRGREQHLVAAIRSVGRAARSAWYPREVVVVSADIGDLAQLVAPVAGELSIPIRAVVAPDAATIGALRNRGLRAVTTEWVHFIDSDTIAPADYFVALEREAAAHGDEVQGFQLNFAPAPGASYWAREEAEFDRAVLSRYIAEDGVAGLNGMNFVARVAALLAVGGFDEDLVAAEDIELGFRLHRRGIPVAFLPGVKIHHDYPNRLRTILRRKFWHGRGYHTARRKIDGVFRALPSSRARRRQAGGAWPTRLFRLFTMGVFLTGWASQLVVQWQRSG